MRICEINPFFYPYRGGIENRIYNISKEIAKENEVYVVTTKLPGTKEKEEMDGIKIIRLPAKYFGGYNPPFVITRGFYRKLMEIKPDVINYHYRWAPKMSFEIVKTPFPKVFTYHNDFGEGVGMERFFSFLNDAIFKIFLKQFDKIICISNYVKHRLIRFGIEKEKLVTIYNGIEGRGRIYSKDDYLLFIGRMVRTKGLDKFMKGLSYAMKKGIDARFIAVGKGPMKKKWENMAGKYGIKAFFPGWIDEERKLELLKRCKIFVLPSIRESFGIVLLEAMKYGNAILASNVGGIREVVGDAGMLVKPSAENFGKAIESIYNDDELLNNYRKNAIKRIERFRWDKIARETIRVYREIVK